MAHFVFTDGYVSINAVVLSAHVKSVTLDYSAELQDDTSMGDTTRERKGGLKDWSVGVEFFQDFAASQVDATLFALVGTTFTVEVRPTSGARSATNPGYSGTGILESYQPIGSEIGAMAMAPVTIQAAGVLSRLTA
jgi:hypothetical protein